MSAPAWSCTVTADDGLLVIRFRPGLQEFAATPAAARALACKLLLVAEEAETPRHYGVDDGRRESEQGSA